MLQSIGSKFNEISRAAGSTFPQCAFNCTLRPILAYRAEARADLAFKVGIPNTERNIGSPTTSISFIYTNSCGLRLTFTSWSNDRVSVDMVVCIVAVRFSGESKRFAQLKSVLFSLNFS